MAESSQYMVCLGVNRIRAQEAFQPIRLDQIVASAGQNLVSDKVTYRRSECNPGVHDRNIKSGDVGRTTYRRASIHWHRTNANNMRFRQERFTGDYHTLHRIEGGSSGFRAIGISTGMLEVNGCDEPPLRRLP